MKFADADRASWRTRERRRQADIAFLAKLRTATLDELRELGRHHAHKKTPRWKQIAIERAIARLQSSDRVRDRASLSGKALDRPS